MLPFTDRSGRHESWFLFNDELVTKIDSLGDRISQKQNRRETAEEDEKWVISNVVTLLLTFSILRADHLDILKKRRDSRKRRRIDDSDGGDDVE